LARHKQTDREERHTAPIRVHATPRERSELQEEAARRGMSLSSYAHDLMFRRFAHAGKAVRRIPEAAAIMRALDAAAFENNAVGVNLNQIARQLNMSGTVRDVPELREALKTYEHIGELYEQALARLIAL
jgi:Bacterial mobilisation protein (MobC)